MATKKVTNETLDLRARTPKITAVHRWATGYQMLTFSTMAEFQRAKDQIEGKMAKTSKGVLPLRVKG